MKINYLIKLKENPIKFGHLMNFPIKSISIQEIEDLQGLYNAGNQFPRALKELLYLAGKDCYVLSYGLMESQQEMQEHARDMLAEDNLTIERPFYAIDFYSDGDQFMFVYLDEGVEDPILYRLHTSDRPEVETIKSYKKTLSEYINDAVENVKRGISPF